MKKLESWIYQLTRNAIINSYRSKRATTTLDKPEALHLSEELPDEDVVTELFPSVRAMVLSLPKKDRQALTLTEYQGLTQKELAQRLGLSLSGAKSRVQRAREKLKQQLLACCHLDWIGVAMSSTINHAAHVVQRTIVVEWHQEHQKHERASFLMELRLQEQKRMR